MVDPSQAQTSALTAPDRLSESVHHRKSLSAGLLVTLDFKNVQEREVEPNVTHA